MRKKLYYFYLALFLVFGLGILLITTRPNKIQETRYEHRIAGTRIFSQLSEAPGVDLLMFNMHDDEDTCVDAAEEVLRKRGGRILQLKHSGQRRISFELSGQEVSFDPNRIFTGNGCWKTLEASSPPSLEAFGQVRTFAQTLLRRFRILDQSLIVTLHNNQDDGYSALSYAQGGEYEADAKEVFVSPETDPDDFFFVTDDNLFAAFKRRGWNVVLQDNTSATDDGSLSVLAGQHGLMYVNVEAQHGHLVEQKEMIDVLFTVAADYIR